MNTCPWCGIKLTVTDATSCRDCRRLDLPIPPPRDDEALIGGVWMLDPETRVQRFVSDEMAETTCPHCDRALVPASRWRRLSSSERRALRETHARVANGVCEARYRKARNEVAA